MISPPLDIAALALLSVLLLYIIAQPTLPAAVERVCCCVPAEQDDGQSSSERLESLHQGAAAVDF
jgi:hypothetical protein